MKKETQNCCSDEWCISYSNQETSKWLVRNGGVHSCSRLYDLQLQSPPPLYEPQQATIQPKSPMHPPPYIPYITHLKGSWKPETLSAGNVVLYSRIQSFLLGCPGPIDCKHAQSAGSFAHHRYATMHLF